VTRESIRAALHRSVTQAFVFLPIHSDPTERAVAEVFCFPTKRTFISSVVLSVTRISRRTQKFCIDTVGSVAEWLACWTQAQKTWVQIAAATLSGNSLKQTAHTRRASVHQAAKLVAALLRVAKVGPNCGPGGK